MIVAAADTAADRRADHHLRAVIAPGAIAHLGQLVHDLVVRGPDEVGELDLWYRHQSVQGHAHGTADDAALAERRIDHAIFAELVKKLLRDAKDATYFADVLAEQHDAIIAAHLLTERVIDRLDHVHLGHRSLRPMVRGLGRTL